MVLWSMHECMHAARFCSGFFFFYQGKLLIGLLCYEDDSFAILFRFNRGGAVSRQILKQKINKRDSCGTRGIGLWLGRHFALHNYTCSTTIGVDSITSSSQGCQGLLQSVPSLQVSVAMLYSIVMVSIGSSSGY